MSTHVRSSICKAVEMFHQDQWQMNSFIFLTGPHTGTKIVSEYGQEIPQ